MLELHAPALQQTEDQFLSPTLPGSFPSDQLLPALRPG